MIFFLPWMNFALAGTTDNPCSLTDSPSPTEGEVSFILNEIRDYLSPDIKGPSANHVISSVAPTLQLILIFSPDSRPTVWHEY